MEVLINRDTSIAFFTLVLFAATWYHIKKAKQQSDEKIYVKTYLKKDNESELIPRL